MQQAPEARTYRNMVHARNENRDFIETQAVDWLLWSVAMKRVLSSEIEVGPNCSASGLNLKGDACHCRAFCMCTKLYALSH